MKKLTSSIIIFSLLITTAAPSAVDLMTKGQDPVSIGQGGTVSVYNEDNIWNVYNNQAALGRTVKVGLGLSFHNYLGLFNGMSFAFGFPGRRGYAVLAGSILHYGASSDKRFGAIDVHSALNWNTSEYLVSDTFRANDWYLVMGYGSEWQTLKLMYGFGVKVVESSIQQRKSTFLAVDLNLLKYFDERIYGGLNIHNLGFGVNDETRVPLNIAFSISVPLPFAKIKGGGVDLFSEFKWFPRKTELDTIGEGSLGAKLFVKDFSMNLALHLSGVNPYIIGFGAVGLNYNVPKTGLKINYALSSYDFRIGMTHHVALSYGIPVKVKGVRGTYKFGKKKIKDSKKKEEEEAKQEEAFFRRTEEEEDKNAQEFWSDDE